MERNLIGHKNYHGVRFVPFVLFTETAMTLFLAYIIIYAYDHRKNISFKEKALLFLALVMMGSMLNSLTYYLMAEKNFLDTIIAVNISMITMSAALLILLLQYTAGKLDKEPKRNFAAVFSSLLVYNEISMGVFVYSLAFGYNLTLSASSLPISMIDIFSLGVNGYLFIAPMVVEMSVFFFLRPVNGIHRIILLSLLLTAAVSPTIGGNYLFTMPGSLLILVLMVGFVIIIFGRMMKGYTYQAERKETLWIFPIFLLMMIGVFFGSFYNGNFPFKWAIYGVSMIWGMSFYFVYSLNQSGNIE